MNYILKSNRVDFDTNNYVLYNSTKQTRTSLNLMPNEAERLRITFSLSPVSPMDVLRMGLNDFEEVKI